MEFALWGCIVGTDLNPPVCPVLCFVRCWWFAVKGRLTLWMTPFIGTSSMSYMGNMPAVGKSERRRP